MLQPRSLLALLLHQLSSGSQLTDNSVPAFYTCFCTYRQASHLSSAANIVVTAMHITVLSAECGTLLSAQAVWHVILDGLIAALGVAVGGLIALPSLASYSLRMEVAEVLMKVGHSLSG